MTDATSGYLIRAAQLIGHDGLERESVASLYDHLVLLDQSSDLDIARLVRDKAGQLHLKLSQCRSVFGEVQAEVGLQQRQNIETIETRYVTSHC